MTTSTKAIFGLVLLFLLAACDNGGAVVDAADAGFDAGEASCIMEAGPDVDPLMTCSPSGCIPFDNSVVPNAPRL
jgi:hypothetical protein